MSNQPITEILLERADGSTTEIARRLTLKTGEYYTLNQVSHWIRTGRIPAEHAHSVAETFNLRIEDVAPYLFKRHHDRKTGGRGHG